MKTITMKKSELLTILKTNRKVHIAEFTEMMEQYIVRGKAEIRLLLSKFSENPDDVQLHINLNKPSSEEKNYTMVIEMLGHDITETVELTQVEYQNYVNDEWSWSSRHAISKTAYGMH